VLLRLCLVLRRSCLFKRTSPVTPRQLAAAAGYPWGQQPAAYVAAFRMAAAIIHNNTCASKMLWAPNNGYGYPWPFYPCGPRAAPCCARHAHTRVQRTAPAAKCSLPLSTVCCVRAA